MERLRQLISYINTQFGVLTVSQRLAIALCAAMIMGSLLWLLQWSTTPEMVPVTNREFTYEQLDSAEESLKEEGIGYEVRGTRVYVKAVDRHSATRVLHGADALPEGALYDMYQVVSNPNPFIGPEARKTQENYARGNELAKTIATSPLVREAHVVINDKTVRRLGGRSDVPTASVTVTLEGGKEMTSSIVDGMASLVAGAVSGLKPHNVTVYDARTSRAHRVPHPDDGPGFDEFEAVDRFEQKLLTKIRDGLADIPGVQATVTVLLDTTKKVTQKTKLAPVEPKREMRRTSESGSGKQPTEPGVQANVGTAVTAGGQSSRTSEEESETEFQEQKVEEVVTEEKRGATPERVTATVGIPRSYVEGIVLSMFPDKTEVKDDDPDFVKASKSQLDRVKNSVIKIVQAEPSDVQVDIYPDMEWQSGGGVRWRRGPGGVVSASSAEGVDAISLVRGYGPQAGLATLALMSMFMMMRVVRKSADIATSEVAARRRAETPELSDEEEAILTIGTHPVGQAGAAESLLAGKEVDETTLRNQELSDEVSRMVEADPAGAADMLQRWIEDNR